MNCSINFVKIRSDAVVPTRATKGSAGWDLYAWLTKDISISHGELVKIPTGIAIELPHGNAAFIFARSGLGIKFGIMPANGVGVIDSDYRGEIQIGLCRVADGEPYTIKNGDRIAQMIIMKHENFIFNETTMLSETIRGVDGFGSSGK